MGASAAVTQRGRSFRTLLLAVTVEPGEIGRRIKRARESRGWTQLVFAREASVSPSTVQRWEAGALPPVRELIRIADVLQVETDVLVEPEERPGDRLSAIEEELRLVRAELAAVRETLPAVERLLVAARALEGRARADRDSA